MKKTFSPRKGVWLCSGILPRRLAGRDLALALLLQKQPLTLPQLCEKLSAAGTTIDRRALLKSLARLKSRGIVEETGGKYVCRCNKLENLNASYTESQLLDLVGLTQSTAAGRAFYTPAPPMSASSGNASLT